MPEARERAEKADKKVNTAERGLWWLIGLFASFFLILLIATTTFSAYSAVQAQRVAKLAAIQSGINHKTGLANQQILTQINEATSHHTQTINDIANLQEDLDRKFSIVVHASCLGHVASSPECVAIKKAEHRATEKR